MSPPSCSACSASHLLLLWFIAWLILWPWRWKRVFLQNFGWLSTDYTTLYPRRQNSSSSSSSYLLLRTRKEGDTSLLSSSIWIKNLALYSGKYGERHGIDLAFKWNYFVIVFLPRFWHTNSSKYTQWYVTLQNMWSTLSLQDREVSVMLMMCDYRWHRLRCSCTCVVTYPLVAKSN
jgi:hypothetical protein